jgi:hypothetical protein
VSRTVHTSLAVITSIENRLHAHVPLTRSTLVNIAYVAALSRNWPPRHRARAWLPWHISLMCGSYISLPTALLVINLGLDDPVAWMFPTVVGSPLIAWRVPGRRA